jgi:HAMP domain-containing protein
VNAPGKGAAASQLATGKPSTGNPPLANGPLFGSDASGYFQVVPSFATATKGERSVPAALKAPLKESLDGFIPAVGLDASVARGLAPPYFREARYRGVALELYTMHLPSSSDGLVRTARPLTEANATITRVRWLLLALTLGGALAAGLLGRLAANAVLRPVRALAGAVREVSATRDLNQRIPVRGRDELASLAGDFNAMLAALEESQQAQRQLIADASHELRTPLTAHRANVELLARPDLPAEQRQRVLGAAVRTIGELSTLVGDLIQAARDGRSVDARQPPRSTSSCRQRSNERSTGRRPSASRAGSSPAGLSGPARGWSARSTMFSTTRSSGARPAAPLTSLSSTGGSWCKTTGPVSLKLTCHTSSTASTAPPRRVPCPVRGWGSRSSSRPSMITEAASPSPTPMAVGRS